MPNDPIGDRVGFHRPAGKTRDDQRRAGLIDEHGIHFVDQRIRVSTLDDLRGIDAHVVAQIVEAELAGGSVGHVGRVRLFAPFDPHAVLNEPDAQSHKAIDRSHPFAVALGQIVIHREQVRAFARQRVQINGQRSDEGFPLSGRHLGDHSFMQSDPADQLDVPVPELEHAPGRLANRRERLRQKVVQRFPRGKALLELRRFRAQLLVAELLHRAFQRVDGLDRRLQRSQLTPVVAAEHGYEQAVQQRPGAPYRRRLDRFHGCGSSGSVRRACENA